MHIVALPSHQLADPPLPCTQVHMIIIHPGLSPRCSVQWKEHETSKKHVIKNLCFEPLEAVLLTSIIDIILKQSHFPVCGTNTGILILIERKKTFILPLHWSSFGRVFRSVCIWQQMQTYKILSLNLDRNSLSGNLGLTRENCVFCCLCPKQMCLV